MSVVEGIYQEICSKKIRKKVDSIDQKRTLIKQKTLKEQKLLRKEIDVMLKEIHKLLEDSGLYVKKGTKMYSTIYEEDKKK